MRSNAGCSQPSSHPVPRPNQISCSYLEQPRACDEKEEARGMAAVLLLIIKISRPSVDVTLVMKREAQFFDFDFDFDVFLVPRPAELFLFPRC